LSDYILVDCQLIDQISDSPTRWLKSVSAVNWRWQQICCHSIFTSPFSDYNVIFTM